MRARRIGVIVTIAGVVASLAALSPARAGETQPALASRGARAVVPLSADLTITRTEADAAGLHQKLETQRFYRDTQGRTRTETGSTVKIADPANGTTITLDVKAGTFTRQARRSQLPAARPEAQKSTPDGKRISSAPRSLGTAVIEGVKAEGNAYTLTIPALDDRPSKSKEVTIWNSADLQLPLRLTMVEASGAGYAQSYSNIKAGVEPAGDLFAIPSGYSLAVAPKATPDDATVANTPCLWATNSPLVINSVGPFLAAGTVAAFTFIGGGSGFPPLPDLPCLFEYDEGGFEYPLIGYPTTPLPNLFYDYWAVEDSGGVVPWIPYVSFGYIYFRTRPLHLVQYTSFYAEVVLLIN
jgi:hypothetical protein